MTDTGCQCSTNEPAETCLISQGNGTCVTGPCNEGYKCDCDGYELCSVATCDSYSKNTNAVLSNETAFPCSLSKGTGFCIAMVDVMDTVRSASLAVVDADMNHDKVINASVYISEQVHSLQGWLQKVTTVLKKVQMVIQDLSDAERRDIYDNVEVVEHSIETMSYMVVSTVQYAHSTSGLLKDAYNFWREASAALKLKNERVAELEAERKKPLMDSELVSSLESEIKELKAQKKMNSKNCNEKALEIRRNSLDAQTEMNRARILKMEGEEAAALSIENANKSIEKAKSVSNPSSSYP